MLSINQGGNTDYHLMSNTIYTNQSLHLLGLSVPKPIQFKFNSKNQQSTHEQLQLPLVNKIVDLS